METLPLASVRPVLLPPAAARTPLAAARDRIPGSDIRAVNVTHAIGRPLSPDDPRRERQAAALMLSQLFFAPLLAEARALPFGKTFANGGRGEEVFAEQLDLRVADQVAASDPGGLTTDLSRRLARRPLAPPLARLSEPTRVNST